MGVCKGDDVGEIGASVDASAGAGEWAELGGGFREETVDHAGCGLIWRREGVRWVTCAKWRVQTKVAWRLGEWCVEGQDRVVVDDRERQTGVVWESTSTVNGSALVR